MNPCDEAFGRNLGTCCTLSHGQARGGPGQAGSALEARLELRAPVFPPLSARSEGRGRPQGGCRGDTGVSRQAPLPGPPRRGIGSYLRIWASCRPPPPRGPRRSRCPAGPSDGAPCSPARRGPAGRRGRSTAAAAAPWPRPARQGGGQGEGAPPAIGARPGGPGRAGRLRLARLSRARAGRRRGAGGGAGRALKPRRV